MTDKEKDKSKELEPKKQLEEDSYTTPKLKKHGKLKNTASEVTTEVYYH